MGVFWAFGILAHFFSHKPCLPHTRQFKARPNHIGKKGLWNKFSLQSSVHLMSYLAWIELGNEENNNKKGLLSPDTCLQTNDTKYHNLLPTLDR